MTIFLLLRSDKFRNMNWTESIDRKHNREIDWKYFLTWCLIILLGANSIGNLNEIGFLKVAFWNQLESLFYSFFFFFLSSRFQWIKNRSVKLGMPSTHCAAISTACVRLRFIRLNLSSLRQVKTPLSSCGTFRKPYLLKSKPNSIISRSHFPFQPVS